MKKRSEFQVMMKLVGLVKPLAGYMILAIIMGLIGHLCASWITIFGGYAVLSVLGFSVPFSVRFLFVSVCVFALLRGILRYAEQGCNHFIAFKLLALIRDQVFQALRRLCPAKLEGKDKGDLISVITSDIELLEVFYAHTISPSVIALLFTIVMCLFIGSFHWALGVLALAAYVIVGFVIPVIVSRASGDVGMKFRSGSGELSSFVLDSLRGLSETQQYGQGEKRLEQISKKTDDLSASEERMKRISGRNIAVTNTAILLLDLCMLFASGRLYQLGTVDFSGVLIPTIALMSSFGPVVALANLGSTLQNTFAAGNRVLDILEESPAVEEITGKEQVAFTGASAEHVTFSYGQDKEQQENILSNISVEIPEHQVTGIVGRSGSGKSTLLKLFMRFWKVQEGNVAVSGTSVEQINTVNLRNMESFVTQETHLFHDSIKNNLKIAKLDATDEEIVTACQKASVHDFIMSLPNGYDTEVGELGDTLSGGERQRLGLARAFLHDAPFLLLDEPTSNLDSLNEAVILKSLKEEQNGKTIVLVSHRQSTMCIADTVYSVEHGRVS
jgi:ATP-binding cassette subfamily C protein